MSNAQQSSLNTILEQAEAARDEAVAQFEVSRKAYEGARQQLQSLHDFRSQYQSRWQSQFQQAGGMEILRCYQDFMARLTEAEVEQQRRTEHSRGTNERYRLALIERERRVAAVSQLIQRREKEELAKANRRDQKATDEMAARLISSGKNGPMAAPAA